MITVVIVFLDGSIKSGFEIKQEYAIDIGKLHSTVLFTVLMKHFDIILEK